MTYDLGRLSYNAVYYWLTIMAAQYHFCYFDLQFHHIHFTTTYVVDYRDSALSI